MGVCHDARENKKSELMLMRRARAYCLPNSTAAAAVLLL